jgi:hypothetical protein
LEYGDERVLFYLKACQERKWSDLVYVYLRDIKNIRIEIV